jgi:hypothetical protein
MTVSFLFLERIFEVARTRVHTFDSPRPLAQSQRGKAWKGIPKNPLWRADDKSSQHRATPRVPKSGLNASRGKPYYLKRLSCADLRIFDLSGSNFHPLVSTEGEDELPILLHTWMEKHEILVYPIHQCMLELRAHAEMKSNITHFENGCAK